VHNIDGYWAGIFIVRIALGIVMIAHGYNHIWGGGKIKGTAGWFESLGMKPGIVHAWLASVTELAVGVMLIFGFLTPLACGGVMGVMLVAFITNHLKNGFFIFRPGEGYEYVLTLLLVSFGLAGIGAGKWAIDHEITGSLHAWLWGLKGLGVAAVAGLGGGALLLAVFWRPEKKSD
jgi:putative oxidoreductase